MGRNYFPLLTWPGHLRVWSFTPDIDAPTEKKLTLLVFFYIFPYDIMILKMPQVLDFTALGAFFASNLLLVQSENHYRDSKKKGCSALPLFQQFDCITQFLNGFMGVRSFANIF